MGALMEKIKDGIGFGLGLFIILGLIL